MFDCHPSLSCGKQILFSISLTYNTWSPCPCGYARDMRTWTCKKGKPRGKPGILPCSSQGGWKRVRVVIQTEVGHPCSQEHRYSFSGAPTQGHSQGWRARAEWWIDLGNSRNAGGSSMQCLGTATGDFCVVSAEVSRRMWDVVIECLGQWEDDRKRIVLQKGCLMALLGGSKYPVHWCNLCLFLPPHVQPPYLTSCHDEILGYYYLNM